MSNVKSQMSAYEKLRQTLDEKGVALNAVRINETPSDNTYCILNYGDEIEIFYFERGIKFDLRTFKVEDEAIGQFEEWVLAQQHVYKNWGGVVR